MSVAFDPTRVSREDLIESSVLKFVQDGLAAVGLGTDKIGYKESFNTDLFEGEIDRSYIAAGFHMNDGGRLWELGGTLRRKVYTFEYWVIGLNYEQGKNLAHQVGLIIEGDLIIPILDFTQPGAPVIDALESAEHPAKVERAIVGNPEPWQQYLYTVNIPVLDFYYP